ncbi:methyltransferase domain-containing protein [Aliidiomarina celeris]|uniref:methyltransferase domain-containing protein n=1 Tax=Aliidiomarina celeris TaxID=2249428 RepID=UPI0013009CA2|nr:methyltransferase domain-containing protein [Aliidiomarina celeris]
MEFKQAVSCAFGRQAVNYTNYCYRELGSSSLQAQAAALIQPFLRPCNVLLDLGCGPAVHTTMLRHYCDVYWGVDISAEMLKIAKQTTTDGAVYWLQGDAEALCFADHTVDFIYSNMAVQWCESPKQVLTEAMRVLQPGGRLLFTTLVKGSTGLLTALHQQGLLNHSNQYPELSVWSHHAAALGFSVVNAEIHSLVTEHESPRALLESLKQIGANARMQESNAEQSSSRSGHGLKTKNWLFQLYREIEKYREHGAIPLNYEVARLVFEKRC